MSGPVDANVLKNRFRGALLGTAIGDALGAPFEGAAHVSQQTLTWRLQHPGKMTWTDDTHMTIGLTESLIACGGLDGCHLARHFASRYQDEPWRGYGAGPPQIFAALEQGAAWDEVGQTLFGGAGSYGNGAAMRVAPVGLLASDDLELVADLARNSACITHTHQWGLDGAVVQACAVALLARHQSEWPPDRAKLVTEIRPHVRSRAFNHALDDLLALPLDAEPDEVVTRLGRGIEAMRSVPTALFTFLRSPHSFADTVLYAVGLGGDADTIGAMAGALAGTYLGQQGIPSIWRAEVEASRDIVQLAERLFQLTHENKGHRLGREQP
ncbi:MAG: ADP-ribosylglycohydrolase family protein [Phycisphaeraceae bacterium]